MNLHSYLKNVCSYFVKSGRFIIIFSSLQFIVITILLVSFYLNSPIANGLISWLYEITIPAYYYVFVLVLSIILSPLSHNRFTKFLIIVPFFILQLLLVIDWFVYNIFRFHINPIFINMFIYDFKGIGFSPFILFLILLFVFIFAALNIFLLKITPKIKLKKSWLIAVILIPVFILNQFIHIWGIGFNQIEITKFTPYFPFFFPTTSHKMVKNIEKNFSFLIPNDFNRDENFNFSSTSKKTTLTFPLKPIEFDSSAAKQFNILFFVLESWRARMMDNLITPNIYEFSKKCINLDNHLSGGNVTVSGLFSLIYGLHPSYAMHIQSQPAVYKSGLNAALETFNFQTSVYTSSNLARFSLKEMFFRNVKPNNYHYLHSTEYIKNDNLLVDSLKLDIESTNKKSKKFWFTFLTSSHHSYYYPKSHEVFKPVGTNGGFLIDKFTNPEPYLNDYKNSLHFSDSLFAEVLNSLNESGLIENTIIIITSDHGEAFNDNNAGYWGHGSNFTKYQISVPLLIYLPDNPIGKTILQRTGHVDIIPSILKYNFSCKNQVNDFSSGYNFYDLPKEREVIAESYVDKAYIVNDTVYVNNLNLDSYILSDKNKKIENKNYSRIKSAINIENNFLKKQ